MKKQNFLSLAVAVGMTSIVNAHSLWIVPSQTQFSGDKAWVTFDAAASNQMFIANHASLDLVKMNAWSPSNQKVSMQNAVEGRVRTVFDLQLQEPGTYQVLRSGVSILARGKPPEKNKPKDDKPNGKPKQRRWWRGTLNDYLAGKYPDNFSADNFITLVSQVETFVTLGAPTKITTAPSQYGMDIDYLTHPNALYTGEVVNLRVLVDGHPAANIDVEIIAGNSQYRDSTNPLKLTSNADGEIAVIWQKPGMYWLHAKSQDDKGMTSNKKRRLSYTAVLEVLPE